jgi:hypothetical protein
MKNKNTTPLKQFQNQIKKIDYPNTNTWALTWLGTDTSIKSDGVELVL